MANIIDDIVQDYQSKLKRGINEVYYKTDLLEGLKLIVTMIGLLKIAMLIGGMAAAAIGSIISFAMRNPQGAMRLGKMISQNSESIKELITKGGDKLNRGYTDLPENQKKMVRTVVLLVAKGGFSWEHLHWIIHNHIKKYHLTYKFKEKNMANNSPGAYVHVILLIGGAIGLVFPPLLILVIFIGAIVLLSNKK